MLYFLVNPSATFFMLEYPSHQIIGHADIPGPYPMGHDIDVIFLHMLLMPPDFRFLDRGVNPEPSRRALSE